MSGGPSSSAEVRGLVIHDIKEVEGVRQQEEQEDKRDEEIPSPRKLLQIQIGNKIENLRTVTDYRRYRFIINRKQQIRIKITDVTGVTDVTVFNKKGTWHVSKHSLFS